MTILITLNPTQTLPKPYPYPFPNPNQARRMGQEEYFDMHRAWCTEGKGKDDADSLVCKRWQEAMGKAEL